MKIEKFEDIIAWQKARTLTRIIYGVFRGNPDRAFKDQIQRASISIMNNIAEGFERRINKEFRQFLFIAKGSSGEVRSMVHIGSDLGYITKDKKLEIENLSLEISKILSGFIKHL
jgi:four helix bundle protein